MKHRYQIAVPFIVFACAVGATLAYSRAAPDPDAGTKRATPAFTRVAGSHVARLAQANAAIYEQRIERQRMRVGARRAAIAWVSSLARGGRPAPQVLAGTTGAATVVRWLDDLPVGLVAFKPSAVTATGDPTVEHVVVRGMLVVSLNQATGKARTFRSPLRLRMSPRSGGKRWLLDAATAGGTKGLRSYDDPVVVEADGVHVVAPDELAAFAADAATQAARALPELRKRYASVAGPERVTVYVVQQAAQVPLLLGEEYVDVPAHPSGWTYEDGDVVVVWDKLAKLPSLQRVATVRHELTHVVTLPLSKTAPTLVLEGLATWEETRLISGSSSLSIDLRPLRDAFRNGTVGYRDLLGSTATSFGRTKESEVQIGYLAGYATIGFIEAEYGHTRLERMLTLLRSGVSIGQALDRALSLKAVALERKVRVWTAEHVRTHGESAESARTFAGG